jgi:site-specific recombinase XerD
MKLLDSAHAWLAHLRLQRYAEETMRGYSDQFKRFGEWLDRHGIDDLRAVTRAHMNDYQAFVRSEPIGVHTQSLRVRALKSLYEYLVEGGQLVFNPAAHLVSLKRKECLPKNVPTVKEIERLLATPDTGLPLGIRDRALLEVLYGTGIRVGELEKVTVHHIDLNLQTIEVRHAKGGRARIVPLTKEATHWLRQYVMQVRPKLVLRRPFERALFLVVGGRPLLQTQIRALLHQYGQNARLKKRISPHGLRHACATHLVAAGADIMAVKELLGHANLETTQLYTRVAPTEVKSTHQRFHPKESAATQGELHATD